MIKIMQKLNVVLPKIPDDEDRKTQEAVLGDIKDGFQKYENNEDELKRLLVSSKSHVFNLHVKYPFLKKAYDEAEGIIKEDTVEQEKDILLSTSRDYELRKKETELKIKKIKAYEMEDSDEEQGSKNLQIKLEFIEKLKEMQKAIDKHTDELQADLPNLKANLKETEFINKDGTIKNQKPLKEKVEWVEREDNKELKELFEKNQQDWMKKFEGNLKEGQTVIKMNSVSSPLNPSSSLNPADKEKANDESGLDESGTYVLRNGKLVKGEGRK